LVHCGIARGKACHHENIANFEIGGMHTPALKLKRRVPDRAIQSRVICTERQNRVRIPKGRFLQRALNYDSVVEELSVRMVRQSNADTNREQENHNSSHEDSFHRKPPTA
jgi:hypothetical protein